MEKAPSTYSERMFDLPVLRGNHRNAIPGPKERTSCYNRNYDLVFFQRIPIAQEADMTKWYAGLDAHARISSVVIIDEEGDVVFVNDQFRTCKQELRDVLSQPVDRLVVHLESGNVHEDVTELIEDHVHDVVVSNARKNDLVTRTDGGDKEDAHKLARLLRLDEFERIHPETDQKKKNYRDSFLEYVRYNDRQAQIKQNTKMLLQKRGVHRTGSTKMETEEDRARLVDRIDDRTLSSILSDRMEQLQHVIEKRDAAKQRVLMKEEVFPVIGRIKKMPGGGFYTANAFVTEIMNPFRFKDRKQLHKYARLAIESSTSANEQKSGKHINNDGRGMLKDALFNIWLGTKNRKDNNSIHRFYQVSLMQDWNDKTEARLNTMRKICDVIWSMWKNQTAYDDSQVVHPRDPKGS